MPKIIVNGKSYESVDEMPPDIRKIYEGTLGLLADKDQDGIPDIAQTGAESGNVVVHPASISVNSARIVVGDKVYSNVEDLPPEARQKYEQAMAKLGKVMGDANQEGVPDLFAGMMQQPSQAQPASLPETPEPVAGSSPLISGSTPPAITDASENQGKTWLFLLLALLVLLVIGLVALVIGLTWPFLSQLL